MKRDIKNWNTYIIIYILFCMSCNKPENNNDPGSPPPPTDIGTLRIDNINKVAINAFNITYFATSPAGTGYTGLYMIWSTDPNFTNNKDSATISATTTTAGLYALTKLAHSTRYYLRIGATINGRRIYSLAKEMTTDLFKLETVGYSDPPRGFCKDDTTVIFTNLPQVVPVINSDTKVYFGTYECTLVSDQGLTIEVNVPGNIPAGKYLVKVATRGMEATWPDSVEVLRGRWDIIPNPDIPGNPAASYSALVAYGSCYSAQKGYIIGGEYLNGPPIGFPNSSWPEFLLEFDGSSKTWSKRTVNNPHYFEDPHCYYFNNGIYVIAGMEAYVVPLGTNRMGLKKIHRLDVNTLNWTVLGDVPYPTMRNMASFELNNEFYIGMGADSANRTTCCGTPIPSKKFWKYNPASGNWTTLADFPGDHQSFPTCFTINGKGYAFYGAIPIGDVATSIDFRQELWEYNPASNAWTNISLPAIGGPPPGEKYQISVYNGKAYFISAQVRKVAATSYYFSCFNPSLEWDPVSNTYKKVAFTYDPRILKNFFRQGNKFYYQSQPTGYFDSTPFTAFSFEVEQ